MAKKSSGARKLKNTLPPDVEAVVRGLEEFLDGRDDVGRVICNAKCGVYAFFDYDGEPIYVGQTRELLRVRIRRHMTNQRTDAVAMRVLDPMEVADIEVWPIWELEYAPDAQVKATLNAAEYIVYRLLIDQSSIGRILNEKSPLPAGHVELPPSHRGSIVPDELRERLGHPDERMARRALKIAELAGIIRQRDVSVGLRNTLITQAERLLHLAQRRFDDVTASKSEAEVMKELHGFEDM
jgi:hypothetical protein